MVLEGVPGQHVQQEQVDLEGLGHLVICKASVSSVAGSTRLRELSQVRDLRDESTSSRGGQCASQSNATPKQSSPRATNRPTTNHSARRRWSSRR
eukprot:5399493-Prymnesium_polylepis.1